MHPRFHPDPALGTGSGAPAHSAPQAPAQSPPRPTLTPSPHPATAPPPRPPGLQTPQQIPGGIRPAPSAPPPPLRPAAAPAPADAAPKIRALEQRLGGGRHEDDWKRSPNVTGTGAIHVKSFHCKLTGDSLENLDRQINEWLDAHPQYEVKFVTSSVGDWTGKLKEPNLILQVWV